MKQGLQQALTTRLRKSLMGKEELYEEKISRTTPRWDLDKRLEQR